MNPELLAALQIGNIKRLEELIKLRIDIKQTDKIGNTALLIAAANGQIELFEYLLFKQYSNLNEKNKYHYTPLLIAAAYGQIEMFEYLLAKKYSNINERNGFGNTAIHIAAECGQIFMIEHLLEKKYFTINKKNKYGETALLIAAMEGRIPMLEYLLDIPEINWEERSIYGNNILSITTSKINSAETIAFLLKKGVYLDMVIDFNGQNTVTFFESHNNGNEKGKSLVKWADRLLKFSQGINDIPVIPKTVFHALEGSVNARHFKTGNTALHFAIINQNTDLVIGLLDNGADVALQNRDDLSSLDLLKVHYANNPDILEKGNVLNTKQLAAKDARLAKTLYRIAVKYENGTGVEKDLIRAFELYKQAAAKGEARAQYAVGDIYSEPSLYPSIGITVKNLELSSEFYSKAALQGHSGALNSLGRCYKKGHGVVKNEKLAVELFEKAALQNELSAINNLALCYEDGIGICKDTKRAAELYIEASYQGQLNAIVNHGLCYRDGVGVEKDIKRAALIFQIAAERGSKEAQDYIAQLIENNANIPNLDKALEHYSKEKDYSTLGFCHLLKGFDDLVGVKMAIKYCNLALQQNPLCHLDLLHYCQKINHFRLPENEKKIFIEFYNGLIKLARLIKANQAPIPLNLVNREKLLCLAVIYESGDSYLNQDQNLFEAAKYYQKANGIYKDENDCSQQNKLQNKNVETKKSAEAGKTTGKVSLVNKEWVNHKCHKYSTLTAFHKSITEALSESVVASHIEFASSIITEYAFEPPLQPGR